MTAPSEKSSRSMSARDALISAILFSSVLSIFLFSPVHQVTDSAYSMLMSESLLHHRSFQLENNYKLPPGQPNWFIYYFRHGDVYQLEDINGHTYYHCPPGSPILSLPFVAVMNLFGVSAANADGTYNVAGEEKIESILAALLMAVVASLFFYTARLMLTRSWSRVIAAGGVLGTQIWSTASRALWSETWGTLLLATVLLMMVAQELNRYTVKPVFLGTLLSWLYFIKPTYSIHILAITAYIFLFYRPLFARLALTGAAWLATFVAHSWYLYRQLQPSYFKPGRLDFAALKMGLPGNFLSPGRGLLVYVPVLFFVVYLLIRYRRHFAAPHLVPLALIVVIGHTLAACATQQWWGGHGFGPRFTMGLVPWFVLLAIMGVHAMQTYEKDQLRSGRCRGEEIACGGMLLLISIAINGAGALNRATWAWNMQPQNIDKHPERLWDWRQPQFLAGLIHPPLPQQIPELTLDEVKFGEPESAQFLWYGWSDPENDFRWTDSSEAALVFSQLGRQELQLTIHLRPFVLEKHPQQRLSVSLNGRRLTAVSLDRPEVQDLTVDLPGDALQVKNRLILTFPDAIAPQSLGLSSDQRSLGIAVYWIKIERKSY